MKQTIKNASGETVGFLVEQGARILAQDRSGKTFDKSGSPVYIGDMTRALLE